MRSVAIRICAVAAAAGLVASGCSSDDHAGPARFPNRAGRGPCEVAKQSDVPVTMRDGTVLRADVYRPKTGDAVPVILTRTQCGKAGAHAGTGHPPTDC